MEQKSTVDKALRALADLKILRDPVKTAREVHILGTKKLTEESKEWFKIGHFTTDTLVKIHCFLETIEMSKKTKKMFKKARVELTKINDFIEKSTTITPHDLVWAKAISVLANEFYCEAMELLNAN
jgi:hypothetical protein